MACVPPKVHVFQKQRFRLIFGGYGDETLAPPHLKGKFEKVVLLQIAPKISIHSFYRRNSVEINLFSKKIFLESLDLKKYGPKNCCLL
jgi:hypothetical protein